ncbi:MAG TPA: PQQ-binding-like beta-propeller repeat protein [Gaiella sp.]|nr:PQQ-binding-like beta-propeller repeat protein [Gaiella sp.]
MRRRGRLSLAAPFAALSLALVAGGALAGARAVDGDWTSFGRTPANDRHSPLTQITRANVARLDKVYSVDFQKLDPDVRRGQQSYPLAIGGRLFVTTNDDNVFALDGATGKVLWQYKPQDSGFFKNFGIVANRGLAYCDGRLFLAQLDMKLVALRPSDGKVLGVVGLSQDVSNASTNYGYSETSAPICANHRVLIGAAGSEYGIRGFVMAYTTGLRPAWPSPFWTIPPDLQSWRRTSRVVGGGAVWTPVTVDTGTNTVYFGTGSATPLYFPALRPGANPRTDALVAVDLTTGRLKWWQQLIAGNQWAYDVSQPPLVYRGKVGGTVHEVVSVATMEGVWFAFDASTGRPFHERVKVIDHVEHPPLRPGEPVTVFPSSLGGLNYSPASYDPATNYVFNAAAETAAVLIQQKLSPTQKRRKLLLGDVYLGLQNGNFGAALAGWHDHGSISAIDVSTGRRVWKLRTPEPERGGVTTTASGLGFAGGGDGVLRAFDLRTGKVLWTFKTGNPIAAGPTIFAKGGREYVAVTVGGTPTSSNGGTVSQLFVFGLGENTSGRATQGAGAEPVSSWPVTGHATTPASTRAPAATGGTSRIVVEGGAVPLSLWHADSSNLTTVDGRVLFRGKPVSGAVVAIDRYRLPRKTDPRGRFSAPVDVTLARRHPLDVADASHATANGRALSAREQKSLAQASAGVSVGYRIVGLRATQSPHGVLVTGRAVRTDGVPAPGVVLLSYRLQGTITDANGSPVRGATVVTRTTDRDFWTFSSPSDANGHYVSFFSASDEAGDDPVDLSVQVAVGNVSYGSGTRTVSFSRLKSATMDVKLPARGTTVPLPVSAPEPGAFYRGLLVGVSGPAGVVTPIAARWPRTDGRFSLLLPPTVRGKTLRVWESDFASFSRVPATPGGPIDVQAWPRKLSPRVARDLAFVSVGR